MDIQLGAKNCIQNRRANVVPAPVMRNLYSFYSGKVDTKLFSANNRVGKGRYSGI
jgi:hypothetical protein